MDRAYLEILFFCGIVLQIILRFYYVQYYVSGKEAHYFNKKERIFLLFIFVGFQLLPIIYVLTDWFRILDYQLPKWMAFPTIFMYCFGVWLFFRAHSDLGKYWSPGIEIKEGHQLITDGAFGWMRHPMYSAFIVIAIAQIFMLQNYLIGPAFLLLGMPFYMHRKQREEKMLVRHFGDQYRTYMMKTNALFPKEAIWKQLGSFLKSQMEVKLKSLKKRKS